MEVRAARKKAKAATNELAFNERASSPKEQLKHARMVNEFLDLLELVDENAKLKDTIVELHAELKEKDAQLCAFAAKLQLTLTAKARLEPPALFNKSRPTETLKLLMPMATMATMTKPSTTKAASFGANARPLRNGLWGSLSWRCGWTNG